MSSNVSIISISLCLSMFRYLQIGRFMTISSRIRYILATIDGGGGEFITKNRHDSHVSHTIQAIYLVQYSLSASPMLFLLDFSLFAIVVVVDVLCYFLVSLWLLLLLSFYFSFTIKVCCVVFVQFECGSNEMNG